MPGNADAALWMQACVPNRQATAASRCAHVPGLPGPGRGVPPFPTRPRWRLLGTTHSRELPRGPASSEERTGSVARPVRRQGGRTGDQASPMGGGSPSRKVSEGEAPPAPHLPPDRALKSKYVSPLVPFYPCVFIWGETFHIHNIHTFTLCHGTPFLHQAPFNLSILEESLSRRSNPNLWIL